MADTNRYSDIIHLEHHISIKRCCMSMMDRAAQFSPFAALTGYDATIRETARRTDTKAELNECGKEMLNGKIQLIAESLDRQPEVTIVYFEPDVRKTGGAYIRATGCVKKIDQYERRIIMADREAIPIDRIYEIEGELFQ